METFSPYARQFLDRMDKPQVNRIEGILPAIAIDQTNPVRSSRSTVGTMTELNDHLLFARGARLFCRGCGKLVRRDTPDSIFHALAERSRRRRSAPGRDLPDRGASQLHRRRSPRLPGATGLHPRARRENVCRAPPRRRRRARKGKAGAEARRILHVVQDRFRFSGAERERVMEALDTALRMGAGHLAVHVMDDEGGTPRSGSTATACTAPTAISNTPIRCPAASFNSPLGACESCRGFGRVIGIDFGLVIPDETKTLLEGAIKPWTTPSYKECQDDLQKYAPRAGVPLGVPWKDMKPEHKHWVLHGTPDWKGGNDAWKHQWYGVQRFFDWLETKAYKMHVRVLLSKYRSYTPCRLQWRAPEAGRAALAPGHEGRSRRRAAARRWPLPPLHAGGRELDARTAGRAGRPVGA